MSDETFDNNFVWYEWGFVSPQDLPEQDLRDALENEARHEPAAAGWPADDRRDNRWTSPRG